MFLRPGTWDDDWQGSMPGGQSAESLSASFSWTGGETFTKSEMVHSLTTIVLN